MKTKTEPAQIEGVPNASIRPHHDPESSPPESQLPAVSPGAYVSRSRPSRRSRSLGPVSYHCASAKSYSHCVAYTSRPRPSCPVNRNYRGPPRQCGAKVAVRIRRRIGGLNHGQVIVGVCVWAAQLDAQLIASGKNCSTRHPRQAPPRRPGRKLPPDRPHQCLGCDCRAAWSKSKSGRIYLRRYAQEKMLC